MVIGLLKSAFGGAKDAGQDRRRLPRLTEKRATLVLDGASYPLIDWNPKGFQIAPYRGNLKVGNRVRVRLIIPHKGRSFGFHLDGQVKRLNRENQGVGGTFVDVEPEIARKLDKLFAARLS
tara:strand:+ start:4897 stop:5259 length:363 start_codon:yes stop_codon:yes gene_type:complete